MRVILDTNIFISGIFFGGPPGKILQSWRERKFTLVLSPEILKEYQRVAEVLSQKYPPVDLTELLELIVVEAEMVQPEPLKEPVTTDPDDDMFFACALTSGARLIVSGDKHLLDLAGFCGIKVLKPRAFIDQYLA